MEQFKTMFFMSALMILFVSFGAYVGGSSGMVMAFLFALGLNFFTYFYSDKLVLKHYQASPINSNNPLYKSLEELCQKANLPLPKLYLINDSTPNAFATGRNPQNAVVALTSGLLDILSEDEVKAVIAHELGHIKHYDILSGSIVAVFAGAIAMLANFAYMGVNRRNGNALLGIVLAFIMPMAAMIIQMSISRSREYEADKFSANLTAPQHLITSLTKLENYSHRKVLNNADEQSAHMFIINPLSGISKLGNLFRTHPTTQDRIQRLESMKSGLGAYFNR